MKYYSIKLGDRITFRAINHENTAITTRKVRGFMNHKPTVRFEGWDDFVVRWEEIIEVERVAWSGSPFK